jgi:hypothetical protein
MLRRIIVASLFASLLAAMGCVAATSSTGEAQTKAQPRARPNPFVSTTGSSIEIVGPGFDDRDAAASGCADFAPARDQIARFLRQARAISESELHDHHDVLPCWIDAIVEADDVEWQVRLRVGGVARAKSESRVVVLVGRLPG